MRKDQIARLQDMAEAVGEVFLDEADPEGWSGAGKRLADMTPDERGGRYFDKKNAIQTGTLLARILDLRDRDMGQVGGARTPQEDAEKEIKRYENQAKDLINAIQKGSVKRS